MKKILIFMVSLIFIISIGLVLLYLLGSPVHIKTNKKVNGLSKELSDILYYGSLAPNSHNTQMWKVNINPDEKMVKIYLDKNRTLDAVDSKNREAYISIGAYTTNLIKAFYAYDYKVDYIINNNSSDDLIVTLSYYKIGINKEKENQNTEKQKAKENQNIKANQIVSKSINTNIIRSILKRHTDKGEYLNRKITQNVQNKLIQEDDDLYYFNNDSKESNYLRDATLKATKQQTQNDKKAIEFAQWLRLSNQEVIQKKDGIPAELLGLSGIKKTLYYWMTSHESAKGKTFAKQTIETAKKQVNHCAGFLILTGGENKEKLVETGMKLEKLWLRAVNLGVSVQPMSQILEEEPFNKEVNGQLKITKSIQMILRVGYVQKYGKNSQIRRDLDDYISVDH